MKLVRCCFIIFILAFLCAGARAGDELYRIRICNTKGGLIQVSADRGRTYGTVGRVKSPANARIPGFAAASYAPQGTVAATAVHGIRIKTGQYALGVGKEQKPMMFSVCPLEFAEIPSGYGGHRPRSSGIHTDIPAGRSIFRNCAPYVGSKVFLEVDHALEPLPQDYIPVESDVYVIVVNAPDNAPRVVEIENRAGGSVTAIYDDGSQTHISSVVRPVKGVGRYDGTTFTGVGSINTNHCGVITISTAPVQPAGTVEGKGRETRGGFMIQPYYHAAEQKETSPQVMVIGPKDSSKPSLEGTPPLFSGCIDLSRYTGSPQNSMRVEVKIDDGDWEPVPEMVGKNDSAFTSGFLSSYFANRGNPRKVDQGLTAVRLVFPKFDKAVFLDDLAREVADYARKSASSGAKPLKGTVEFAPAKPYKRECIVSFYVDGVLVHTSNKYPYICEWDSTTVPNGLHCLDIETLPRDGLKPVVESRRIMVSN